MTKKKTNEVSFSIECKMNKRWVPQFLAMLKYMQHLGTVGSSRNVTLYSDGDGDFQPKFEIPKNLPCHAKPFYDTDGNRTYDAG